jgi:hypothetical protein
VLKTKEKIVEEELKKLIKEYLMESLEIYLTTEKHYGDYGNGDGVKVSLSIYLDGELVTSQYDFTSL